MKLKPWHEVVELRPGLTEGMLEMKDLAADLHAVHEGKATQDYLDPTSFFELTYPTQNVIELAHSVMGRLSGHNDKAVHVLAQNFGGGKTHSLVALYHLANSHADLDRKIPAVSSFLEGVQMGSDSAQVSIVGFDRLDTEMAITSRSPDGTKKEFQFPWTHIAWQLAGEEGVEIIQGDRKTEREDSPSVEIFENLFNHVTGGGNPVLILLDEVLMWARGMVDRNKVWEKRLQHFFQYLSVSAGNVDRCCVVISVLATDMDKVADEVGRRLESSLFDALGRVKEKAIVPTRAEEVPEVLRRRLFTSESIADSKTRRLIAQKVVDIIAEVDESVRSKKMAEIERFQNSYPFHPDFIDVLQTNWVQIETFQRTRGVLRTITMALRESMDWDDSPLIGPRALLTTASGGGINGGGQDLIQAAEHDQDDTKKAAWGAILQKELDIAEEIETAEGLKEAEVQQAVLGTFLYSQPVGRTARFATLRRMVMPSKAKRMNWEDAMTQWLESSWYLDEKYARVEAGERIPSTWRIGSKPNLNQLHHEAKRTMPPERVTSYLQKEVDNCKKLTEGVRSSDVQAHAQPSTPADVPDDGKFRLVILDPAEVTTKDNPSELAVRFMNEASSPGRKFRNAVLVASTSPQGWERMRQSALTILAWRQVKDDLHNGPDDDPDRLTEVQDKIREAERELPNRILNAYANIVNRNTDGEVAVTPVHQQGSALWERMKKTQQLDLKEENFTPATLLPGKSLGKDIWGDDRSERYLDDVKKMFAQDPKLPRILNQSAILDTIADGCQRGLWVLEMPRADGSIRTVWLDKPDDNVMKSHRTKWRLTTDPDLELHELSMRAVDPDGPLGKEIWGDVDNLNLSSIQDFFDGKRIAKLGYDKVKIGNANSDAVQSALIEAVSSSRLVMIVDDGELTIFGEKPDESVWDSKSITLGKPPSAMNWADILPDVLAGAWNDGVSDGASIWHEIRKTTPQMPWPHVRTAIKNASMANKVKLPGGVFMFENWGASDAGTIVVELPDHKPGGGAGAGPTPPQPGTSIGLVKRLEGISIAELTDIVDILPEVMTASPEAEIVFDLSIRCTDGKLTDESTEKLEGEP